MFISLEYERHSLTTKEEAETTQPAGNGRQVIVVDHWLRWLGPGGGGVADELDDEGKRSPTSPNPHGRQDMARVKSDVSDVASGYSNMAVDTAWLGVNIIAMCQCSMGKRTI